MNPAQKLWVVLDHDGKVIQHSTRPEMVDMMQRYVAQARVAGDAWVLVEYDFSKILECAPSQVRSHGT